MLAAMKDTFRLHFEALHPAYERLLASTPFKFSELAKRALPMRGIYPLTEAGRHLYVGRSDSIRERLKNHCAARLPPPPALTPATASAPTAAAS